MTLEGATSRERPKTYTDIWLFGAWVWKARAYHTEVEGRLGSTKSIPAMRAQPPAGRGARPRLNLAFMDL